MGVLSIVVDRTRLSDEALYIYAIYLGFMTV